MAEGVRYGLMVRTCVEVLRDSGEPMSGREVLDEVAKRVDLNEAELKPHKNGAPAWAVAVGFHTGDAATVGWMVKRDGRWWIAEAGRAALDTYPDPEAFHAEIGRRYREIYRSRKHAREKYGSRLGTIANALELVPAGSWTAYDDLAELVGGAPDEIAHLLAETYIEGSHRVLRPDGRVPEAAHQHFQYRGGDLRARLVKEGVEFDGRHAAPDQRITAEFLRERLAETTAADTPARRAWLVRGANVDGSPWRTRTRCWPTAPRLASAAGTWSMSAAGRPGTWSATPGPRSCATRWTSTRPPRSCSAPSPPLPRR